ncbi:hypothetical protein D3C80_1287340 [compost metagenome]
MISTFEKSNSKPSSATLFSICFLFPIIEISTTSIACKREAAIIILSSFPSGKTMCFRCFLALFTKLYWNIFGVIPSASKVTTFRAKVSTSTYFSKVFIEVSIFCLLLAYILDLIDPILLVI